MSGNCYRRHCAHRDVQVVLVPVPFEGGSPKTVRPVKPQYPKRQRHEHWRGPPRRISKAEVLRRFLRDIAENDRRAREMMRPDAAALKAWLRAA
jgi:hypothetical protein